MTIDEIKAAIERRGYSVQVECYPRSVNFRISTRGRWVNHGYTLDDLASLKLSIAGFTDSMLYALSGGMYHVWCVTCHEPLLQHTDLKLALRYLQTSTKPDVALEVADKTIATSIVSAGLPVLSKDVRVAYGLNGERAIARASEYRSAKAGPDSPALEYCPQCQQHLDDGSTVEIVDVE